MYHWSSLGPVVEGACRVEIYTNDFRLKLKAGSTLEARHHWGPLGGVPVRKQLLELACQLQMIQRSLFTKQKLWEFEDTIFTNSNDCCGFHLWVWEWLVHFLYALKTATEPWNPGTWNPGTLEPWYLLCCWVSKLGKWLGIGETRKIPSLIDVAIMQLHVYI